MSESHADDAQLESRPRPGTLAVTVVKARNLDDTDVDTESDPYVVLTVDGMQRKTTTTVTNSNNPEWNEPFEFDIEHPDRSVLRAEIYDWDRWSTHDPLGWAEIGVAEVIAAEETVERECPLDATRRGGTLTVSLTFTPRAAG